MLKTKLIENTQELLQDFVSSIDDKIVTAKIKLSENQGS